MSDTLDTLVVCTMRSWVAHELAPAAARAGLRMIHSLGLDLPQLPDQASPAWWTPTEHAARLQRAGINLPLLAPGPTWLSTCPTTLTGRTVWSGRLSQIAEAPRAGFAKPAEMKVQNLPAQWWSSTDDFATAARAAGLDDASWVQVTPVCLDLHSEYRAFVADGRVRAVSAYLDPDGHTYDDSWAHRSDLPVDAATAFAQAAATELGADQPPAYVLDVAVDRAGRWLVLEANPAWSSALYGCDVDTALTAIVTATDSAGTSPQWVWQPDPWLVRRAARQRLLTAPLRSGTT